MVALDVVVATLLVEEVVVKAVGAHPNNLL
jgi:hypothetical protein